MVIGDLKNSGSTPAKWVLTAMHESFHVFQMQRGEFQKVSELLLGPEDDPSWQLDFPFPYDSNSVMSLIHLQGYPLYLAATMEDPEEARYAFQTALETVPLYKEALTALSEDDRFYRYSQFQEWKEGVALYSEFRMAELAGSPKYEPSEGFSRLFSIDAFRQAWDRSYRFQRLLVKYAGHAARSRTTFYHLGFGKALVLDRLMDDWKSQYFDKGVWLDNLLRQVPESDGNDA